MGISRDFGPPGKPPAGAMPGKGSHGLEHLRAAHLNLPGEAWDKLLRRCKGDASALERTLGGACEVFDAERGRFALNLPRFLEKPGKLPPSLKDFRAYAEECRGLDYDFLLVTF